MEKILKFKKQVSEKTNKEYCSIVLCIGSKEISLSFEESVILALSGLTYEEFLELPCPCDKELYTLTKVSQLKVGK